MERMGAGDLGCAVEICPGLGRGKCNRVAGTIRQRCGRTQAQGECAREEGGDCLVGKGFQP